MKKFWSNFCTFFVYALLYLPLFVMVLFSFNESRSTSVFTGFSFKWYAELFSRRDVMEALKNTLILAVSASAISTVIGTLAAVGIYRLRSKAAAGALLTVNNIPMMNPDIVTGVSLMLLFVFVGRFLGKRDSLNFATLLISHITFDIPYVVLNVLPKLRQTDKHLTEAALDLGCKPLPAFFKVTLPAISSGIISGMLMAFTLSLDDFVVSYYTNGAAFQTLTLKIFSMTKKTVKPDMYALSSLIFFTILILLIAINLFQMKNEKKQKGVSRR